MRSLIIAGLLATAVLAAPPKWHQLEGYTFDHYIQDFGRRYQKGSQQYKVKEAVFNENLKDIKMHNADKTKTWRKGVNAFTDVTKAQFKEYNRFRKSSTTPPPNEYRVAEAGASIPSSKDWRLNTNPRILTDIKNQGMCGACWAHSSAESMESYFAMLTNQLPTLSTQQIASCTTTEMGCGGGEAAAGWAYVNTTTGLTTEWAYPFVDMFVPEMSRSVTAPCKDISKEFNPFNWFNELTEVGVSGYGEVSPANNAQAAMEALANHGPMSISVAAMGWKDYESGVYQNNGNNTDDWSIDHAVQMVGYGTDDTTGQNYWIVRNSWGTLWGDLGYILLDRPAQEPCNFWGSVCGTSGCLNQLNYPQVFQQKTQYF